jgi:hypothetical protein
MDTKNLLRPIAFSAALLMAAPLGAACERLPQDSRPIAIGAIDDLCARTGELEPLGPQDAEVLEPLASSYATPWLVGKLVVKDDQVVLHLAHLPPQTEDAIIAAVDPFAACASRFGGDTQVVVELGNDGASYDSQSELTEVVLTTNADPSSRVLTQRGALRVAFSHETLHKYVTSWIDQAQAGRLPNPELLELLQTTYMQELYDAAELFRQDHAEHIIPILSKIRDQSGGDMARAVQAVIERLGMADGLKDFSLDCSYEQVPYCVRNNIEGIIKSAGKQLKTKQHDADFKPYQKAFQIIDERYFGLLEQRFAIADESSILSAVISSSRVGHPYDNFSEWIVSLMNSMRFDRQDVGSAILGLTTERQARYRLAITTLSSLTNDTPELHQAVPFTANVSAAGVQ